ncbi:DUF6153 family protein [Nocardia sp.]|uniref:DUF6153 family protein n=1 Tax=Nocardia sp. TaxID=1821 RepID=UPI00260F378E|nr:DUF6153 family protein [Nocardia sp.]
MVELQAHETRYLRAFGLFTLLAGVAIMHSVIFGMGSSHTTAPTGDSAMVTVMGAMSAEHDMTMPGCPGGDCESGHAGMHGCLFVLTTLLLALGLALLGWFGLRQRDTPTTTVRQPSPHRARPPPWTVLSLAELAILRV